MNEYPDKPVVYPVSACCPIDNTQLQGVISGDKRHYLCFECGCKYDSTDPAAIYDQAEIFLKDLQLGAEEDPATKKKLQEVFRAAEQNGLLLDDICQQTQA